MSILFTNAQTYVEDQEERAQPGPYVSALRSLGMGWEVIVRMAHNPGASQKVNTSPFTHDVCIKRQCGRNYMGAHVDPKNLVQSSIRYLGPGHRFDGVELGAHFHCLDPEHSGFM